MISYSYHVCIKIKFIPPLCLSLASGGGVGGTVISGVQASRLSVPHPWKPGSVEVLLLPTLSPGGAHCHYEMLHML